MDLRDLARLYKQGIEPSLSSELEGSDRIAINGVCLGGLALVVSSYLLAEGSVTLCVVDNSDASEGLYLDFCGLLGASRVAHFPSLYKRSSRFGQVDPARAITRNETLRTLLRWDEELRSKDEGCVVVADVQSISELVPSRESFLERDIVVKVGDKLDIDLFEEQLKAAGFAEADYVYCPNQYAIRGCLIDVFGYMTDCPLRIDLDGETVSGLRFFDAESQLTTKKVAQATIAPNESSVVEERVPLFDYIRKGSRVVLSSRARARVYINKVYEEGFSESALDEMRNSFEELDDASFDALTSKERHFLTPEAFDAALKNFRLATYEGGSEDVGAKPLTCNFSPLPLFHRHIGLFRESLAEYQRRGFTTYFLTSSDKEAARLKDLLEADEASEGLSDFALPTLIKGDLHEAFADNEHKCCFFTSHEVFDRFVQAKSKTSAVGLGKAAMTLKALRALSVGDYIVHIDFGIGQFGGLVRKPTPHGFREEIRIFYQHGDILDISIHALYKISKYRRNSDNPPRLSLLGTGAWERMKRRAKARIKDTARDLIALYAKRRSEEGFSFSPDTYLQLALEASFLYEDTPDQARTTAEVKADMESNRPMDRLVCGDVGFGKTEIAIRAAFKAAVDGKQVAVLVPTTVLAFQHFQTFTSRLKDLPVRVEYISRARTQKQITALLHDLSAGQIDILIGTHKLISPKIQWKDLGLLIIDEEQKFGVSVKEKIRQLRSNIDTLTLSATPIPRTLQFSLMGARDISVMRTPPPDRYPISTTITTFDKRTICEAINFEMSRQGQVFFVNDRISKLPEIANLILKEIPDCRIAVAHGQLKSEELEDRLMGFINYEYDLLLTTTIIENGVDIPNANTIIINDAHHFGLADLHQMRGRVGRSNRKAFCLLLAPPLHALNTEARRRLEALETFNDLGAGFAISMQDLDIRGAGNLLGVEQSGFIEDLGYETYQKILTQAVTELKNEEFQSLYDDELKRGNDLKVEEFVDDCTVESDQQMFFPETYVPTVSERLFLYRQLEEIQTDEDLAAYKKNLIDRFGPVPHEGEELMNVVLLRRYGKRMACEKITLAREVLTFQFVSNRESVFYRSNAFGKVLDYITSNAARCQLKETATHRLLLIRDVKTVKEAVSILRSIATQ